MQAASCGWSGVVALQHGAERSIASVIACLLLVKLSTPFVYDVCVFMQMSQLDSSGRRVVTFDGSNASFATITRATPLLPNPGFTITVWVQQAVGSAG